MYMYYEKIINNNSIYYEYGIKYLKNKIRQKLTDSSLNRDCL